MTDIAALKTTNASRWAAMSVTAPIATVRPVAVRLCAPGAKARYAAIERTTGVPWFVIAVIHEREASQDWAANLAQGDPYNKVSTHVPAGRGPFSSFESAAADALTNCPPFAAKWTDWSPGGTMTLLEEYNGLGYANRGKPSPYIWAGTDQYVSGKYVADGVYSDTAIDHQIGCAALLRQMMAIDPSISFTGPAPKPPVVSPTHAGGAAAGAGGAAAAAHQAGLGPWQIFIVACCVFAVVMVASILTKSK